MFLPKMEIAYPAGALACTAIGAVFDLLRRRIPNFITFPAIILALTLHLWLGAWHELGSAAAGALVCGLTFFVLYRAGAMGSGDVKLMAVSGCFAGLPLAKELLILTSLAGGLMGIVLLTYQRRWARTFGNLYILFRHHGTHGLRPHPNLNVRNNGAPTVRLPYALAMAMGSALTVIASMQR